jgi:hypothetical protein
MECKCDMCGAATAIENTKKLLGNRYCGNCISAARSERRTQLYNRPVLKRARAAAKKKLETAEKELKADLVRRQHLTDSKTHSISNISAEILSGGPTSLSLSDLPIRLKRNERPFYLCGPTTGAKNSIALALTNHRLFFVDPVRALKEMDLKKKNLNVTPGIRAISLSTVIAIDKPAMVSERNSYVWTSSIHLDKGTDVPLRFGTCRDARRFHVLLAEMVDRLNDPIDETVFSPKRQRISDDIKVSVWRRDGGKCVTCDSRNNLEYDHIIPVSKGGSNTLRNIELLCEACNRRKSNRLT